MDERLKLTTEQRKVWTKFVSAMKKCDAYGIGFIINGDGCIYAANETDVNGYSFKDDVKTRMTLHIWKNCQLCIYLILIPGAMPLV